MDWEKMQERQRSWSLVWAWTFCRVQASFHVPSVVLKTAWKKFKELLPVLSFPPPPHPTPPHPPFFQDMWVTCTAGVWSAMLHVSETWPLTKPNFQRLQRNDRSMIRQICNVKQQDIVTNRSNEPLARLGIEEQDLILKESSAGMDMWNAPMVQSRQPLTYRLMENVGLGGPRWHGSSWQRGIAESWSSRLSTLMIDILEIWRKICYACSKPASYLEGSPMMWMLPLYLHVNKKKIWW